MMEADLIDHLLAGLAERKSSLELFLSSGSASDYASYREVVGRCQEIINMTETLKEIRGRYIDE
jgi:hypothetical protein